jgi:hypothetical protein
MEPRPDPPPWLPVARTPAPPPAVPDPPPTPPRPSFTWQRLTRTRRGAAGLAIGSAALLLWPFSGWSVIPWLVGLGGLILLRLLRLDGLLRGWVWHLGGLVVVAGLMYSTGPWAWALAASIGVLVAGLLQLPWWRLAAVGVVMCAVSGVGFGISTYQADQQHEAEYAQGGDIVRAEIAEKRTNVLPALLQSFGTSAPDPQPLCRVVTPAALAQLQGQIGGQTCNDVVGGLYARRPAGSPIRVDPGSLPKPAPDPDVSRMVIDACATPWATTAGSAVGRIHIQQVSPSLQTYVVAAFSPC